MTAMVALEQKPVMNSGKGHKGMGAAMHTVHRRAGTQPHKIDGASEAEGREERREKSTDDLGRAVVGLSLLVDIHTRRQCQREATGS